MVALARALAWRELLLCVHRCIMDHATIDRLNILQATMAAMRGAALQLRQLDYLLVDGNRVPQDLPVPAKAIVRGDGSCSCIAAASVIAKVRAAAAGQACVQHADAANANCACR